MSNHKPFQERGAFLRQRRRELLLKDVGRRRLTRQRKRGATREQIAERAGISTDWYAKLEQGYSVSDTVLSNVMDALELDSAQRDKVLNLSYNKTIGPALPPDATISRALQRFIDLQGISPTYIMNERWDIIAWNRAATLVLGDFSKIPEPERNVARLIFTSPAVRRMMGEGWEQQARSLIAELRLSYNRYRSDSKLRRLIDELCAQSQPFDRWWNQENPEIGAKSYAEKRLNHPTTGYLCLEQMSLIVEDAPHLRIVLHSPTDEATARKIRSLMDQGMELSSVPFQGTIE